WVFSSLTLPFNPFSSPSTAHSVGDPVRSTSIVSSMRAIPGNSGHLACSPWRLTSTVWCGCQDGSSGRSAPGTSTSPPSRGRTPRRTRHRRLFYMEVAERRRVPPTSPSCATRHQATVKVLSVQRRRHRPSPHPRCPRSLKCGRRGLSSLCPTLCPVDRPVPWTGVLRTACLAYGLT
ncbi:hypothetical protein BD310DRAFT_995333, partial [Dichomitus squalens]